MNYFSPAQFRTNQDDTTIRIFSSQNDKMMREKVENERKQNGKSFNYNKVIANTLT